MVRTKGPSTTKRVTIMLDNDIEKKLRVMQSKKILTETGSVSFSGVLNETLRKALKL